MKSILRFFTCYCILFCQYSLLAQCPPPGFPQPGNTCPTAPILCANLDNYCATINNNNMAQPFPGCPGNNLNNDEWFAFYAGSTTITVVVTPSNCNTSGGFTGLQAAIYQGCGGPQMDAQCACSANPFTLTASNYIIGQIYYFVIDGCNGSVCDYSIDVTVGSTVGQPPVNPTPFTGPTTVCQGSTTSYSETPVLGATIYNWTLVPASAGTITGSGPSINVNWANNAPASAQLCLTVANACYPNPTQVCQTITITPKPTGVISGSGLICAGGSGSVNLTVTFTGNGPWTFTPMLNGIPQPLVTTSSNPYTYTVTQPGTYTLLTVNTPPSTCSGSVMGTAVVSQSNMAITPTITPTQCGLSNGAISIGVTGGVPAYTYAWSNMATTQNLTNILSGSYTVTVTDMAGCTRTQTMNVPDNLVNINITGTITNNTTCINGNGAIDINVTPAGTYTYIWSNTATTEDLTNLVPGTYTVTVTTGITCTGTASFTVADNPNEPAITFATTPSTCDLANGSINVSVSGGVTPYTFMWLGGQTTEDLSNILAGTYNITVTGANGCTDDAAITLTNNNPNISVSGNTTDNTTCVIATGNGSININVSPAGTYTYIWSNMATTQDLTGLMGGSYSVTVSAGGSCTEVANFTIDNNPNEPNPSSNVVDATCDQSNGSITISVSGGVQPYTFLWSNNATTTNLNNLPAGTYSVTVTGANACTAVETATVDNVNPPININATTTDNTACLAGSANGAINVSVSPAAPYTYIWSTMATTQDLSNLAAGTYTITVSAGGSCTATESFTVDANPNTPNINPTVTNTTCNQSNGIINLSITGGTTPYAILWSNNATTSNLSNLLAGTYLVTVTGSNGCTAFEVVDVSNNNPPISISGVESPNTNCTAAGNGNINISVSPNTGYTYLWSNNFTTQDIGSLIPGTYTVTVFGSGTCSETASFTIDNDPNLPDLSFGVSDATCGQTNGSINLSVSGGVLPYTYLWSNARTTQDINNLPEEIYIVTVTGSNGCSIVDGVVVSNNNVPIGINASINQQTSCLVINGSITLNVSPASATIMWASGSTATSLSNLIPGDYDVTVSLGGTCIETASYTIYDDTEPPNLAIAATPATCGVANGSIDLQVNAGLAPFSYLWSNMATTQDLNNQAPGTFSVTVTSAGGCTATSTATISNNNIALNISGLVTDNNSCTAANGTISLTTTPAGTYNYIWSNTATTKNLTGLGAGTYTVTVSSGTSCSATATFQVQNNTSNPVIDPAVTAAICSESNGAINLTVSGATLPYQYIWSNTATTEDLSAILPGNYDVSVTAANGCSSTATIVVPNNSSTFTLSGNTTALTNCATPNGAIDLIIAPAGPYTINWTHGPTTEDLSGLVAGTYTVSVSEAGSCTASISFIITDQRSAPTTAQSITPELCGLLNGSIDISAQNGQQPYSFNWSNSTTTEDLQQISGGTYTVTVSDVNNCTVTTSATVPANTVSFSLAATSTANTSCIANNGAINLTVSPSAPGSGLSYTYIWSNMANMEDLSALSSGMYTITVSAGGTCANTATFTVDNTTIPPQIDGNITNAFCGQSSGIIDLTVSSGQAPYTYLWSDNALSEDISGRASGTYSVTVTGANGCTATDDFLIDENIVLPSVTANATSNTSCIAPNGAINISVSPVTLAYTYNWSNTATSANLTTLQAGTYTVTVYGGGACTNTAVVVVPNDGIAVDVSGIISPVLCFGASTAAIDLTVNSGIAPFTYNWQPAAAGNPEDRSNLLPGNYAVTVTDALGCTDIAQFVVSQPLNSVQLNCSAADPVSFPGATDGKASVSISGGTAPYNAVVMPGNIQLSNLLSGTISVPNLAEGSYSITLSDANGCTTTCTFSIGLFDCTTAVGTMGSTVLSACGGGCITGIYNPAGQLLDANDAIQFILHQGNSNQIVGELARSSQPQFCFNPATMTLGTTYYIAVVAGNTNTAGNVILTDFCTVISAGTPIVFKPKPDASATPTAPITCATLQVSATGSSSLSGALFNWSSTNNGIVGATNQAMVTVNAAGQYRLIIDVNGCKDTTTVQASDIRNQPKATILASPGDILDCKLDEIVLSGNVEGTVNANAIWVFNGLTFANGSTVPINAPGVYIFAIQDTVTFCADTAMIEIDENQSYPPLTILPPAPLTCAQPATTLTGSSPFPGIQLTWALLNGTDTVVVGTGASLPVNTPGTYILLGLDPVNQCKNSVSTTVIADQTLPVANAGAPFGLACYGETATIGTGPGMVNISYEWTTVNGSFVSGSTTATPDIDAPGTYSLLVSNTTNGCTDTDAVTITPEEPLAKITVKQPLCAGDFGTIVVDTVIGAEPPIHYYIDNQPFVTSNIFSNLQPGLHSVQVTDVNGCTTSESATIVEPIPFEVVLTSLATIKLGESYQIQTEINVPADALASIIWTPSTGLSCDTCLRPIATPYKTTVYEIVAKTASGCEDRASLFLEVDRRVGIYVPNIFTPNGDGDNDVFMLFADIRGVAQVRSFKVYTRWGELVSQHFNFQPNDPAYGWDGRHADKQLNPGVFVWTAVVELIDGELVTLEGDVTLMD